MTAFKTMRTPLVIAHRGDSSNAPENSLEAFRLALSIPVDMVEFDLRMGRDEALYVLHDKHTGRTTDRNIDIELSSSARVSGLRLINGEAVPSLADALRTIAGKVPVNIEIKSSGAGNALCRYFTRDRYTGPLIISSFREAEIRAVHDCFPDLPVAVIYDTFSPRYVNGYKAKGYFGISLRKNTVTEPLIRSCHAHGIRIFVWTVDDEDEMRRCIDWDVDGIYTNRPRILKALLEKRQGGGGGGSSP